MKDILKEIHLMVDWTLIFVIGLLAIFCAYSLSIMHKMEHDVRVYSHDCEEPTEYCLETNDN